MSGALSTPEPGGGALTLAVPRGALFEETLDLLDGLGVATD